MIKTARQLKDLIRNLSREKSADAQLLVRNYMMERLLERISLSEYRDKFILKGGMLVAAMVGLDARSTMDLDATVKGANVNVEEIENLISAKETLLWQPHASCPCISERGALRAEQSAILLIMWQIRKRPTTEN